MTGSARRAPRALPVIERRLVVHALPDENLKLGNVLVDVLNDEKRFCKVVQWSYHLDKLYSDNGSVFAFQYYTPKDIFDLSDKFERIAYEKKEGKESRKKDGVVLEGAGAECAGCAG